MIRKQISLKIFLLVVSLVGLGLFVFHPKTSYATNPAYISFQGKVVNADGTNVTNGTYPFNFILWDNPTAGTNRWQELSKSVTVTNGVFQTNLGSATALPDFNAYPNLYLAIQFNNDAQGYMTPRIQLTSVPYAINSDKLGGLTSASFGQLSATNAWTNTNSVKVASSTAFQVQNSGSNGILTVDTSGGQVLLGTLGASGVNGKLIFNSATAGNFTTTLVASSSQAASYSLTLPTAAPTGTGQCLQTSGSATQLAFGTCGGGGGTFATTYSNTSSDNLVTLTSSGGGVIIQDASSPISGNLFTVKANGSGGTYMGITASAVTMQDTAGNNALVFDSTTSQLKIYGNTTSPTNYLSLYYDNGTSSGIITVSNGTLKVGPGSGPISMVAGASSAVTITGNAASTWSTSTGLLTIQGGTGVSLSGNGSNITIGDTSAGATIVQSSSGLALGVSSSKDGILKFNTLAGANSVGFQLAANPGSSYTLLLPTTGPAVSQCLQTDSSTANQLKFAACGGGGGGDLQAAYNASSSPATISETATKEISITNSSTPTSTTGVDGLAINFNTTGTTNSADNAGMRIDVTSNNNGTTTTLEGLRIGDLSSPEANATETGIYVGTGWDKGLDMESGYIEMAAQSDPAVPPANNLRVWAKSVAGRTVLKVMGGAGIATPLQNAIWQNNTVLWTPGAAAGVWQGTVGSAVGTPAIVLPTTTNFYTSERKSTYAPLSAAANIQCGIRSEAMFFRGNAGGMGGFFAVIHFGTSTWTAGDRLFVGFSKGTTAVTTVNPSTLVDIAGFGIDAGDTAITFMHNDGSGTATKDAIAGQPTLASNQGYDAYIFNPPNSSTIYYRLDNTNTSATIIDTSTTTDLLTVNTMEIIHAEMGTGTNATIASALLGINRIYVETDR